MYPEMLMPSGGSVKSETFNYFFSGEYWIFWIFLLNFVGEFRKDSTLITPNDWANEKQLILFLYGSKKYLINSRHDGGNQGPGPCVRSGSVP